MNRPKIAKEEEVGKSTSSCSFSVGDRISLTVAEKKRDTVGRKGRIVAVMEGKGKVKIEFDDGRRVVSRKISSIKLEESLSKVEMTWL